MKYRCIITLSKHRHATGIAPLTSWREYCVDQGMQVEKEYTHDNLPTIDIRITEK